MGQTYTSTNPADGTTTFGGLYTIIRNHFDACATLFVGGSAPGTPEEGRPWYDSTNNIFKIYDGSAWRDAAYNTETYDEVVGARGTAGDLNTRLSVALNEDGTLSGSTPAGAWWSSGTTPWKYNSTIQFKENGDKTGVYTLGRALKFNGVSGAPQYSYVTACSLVGGTTTLVTLKDAILDSSMETPQYGQIRNNVHFRIPWTRAIFSNSATSKDYAAANKVLVADGSGGVTVTTFTSSAIMLSDHKKFGIL